MLVVGEVEVARGAALVTTTPEPGGASGATHAAVAAKASRALILLALGLALAEGVASPEHRAAAVVIIHPDIPFIEEVREDLVDVLDVGILKLISADDLASAHICIQLVNHVFDFGHHGL